MTERGTSPCSMAKMNGPLLILILALVAVVSSDSEQQGKVTFSGITFTMTCPSDAVTTWSRIGETNGNELTLPYENNNGLSNCKYKPDEGTETTYYFYVKGKVCENCYELDATLLTGIILGDLLVTGGVIILVYHWAQRRAGPSPAQPAGRTGNRAPTVPNRDYEPLNLTNRATETYAGLHRNG